MRSFLFVFGLRGGGGGGFSQDFWIFWIFWNFRSSGPFFFWNEIFVFGFFGFSAVSSGFFFQNLTRTRVFFGMRSFLLFLAFEEGGGGFSQDFWIFWIFWNSCSSGPFFFGMKFLFLDFLEFLQFRALFFQNLTRTRVFFWNSAFFFRPMHLTRICLVIPIQLAVVLSSQILLLLSVLSSVN